MKSSYKTVAIIGSLLALNPPQIWSIDIVHDPTLFAQKAQQWEIELKQWHQQLEFYKTQIELLKGKQKYGIPQEEMASKLPQQWNEYMPNSAPDLVHTQAINDNKSAFMLQNFTLMVDAFNDSKLRLERIHKLIAQIDHTEGIKEAEDLNNRLIAELLMLQENQNRLRSINEMMKMEEELAKQHKTLKYRCITEYHAHEYDPKFQISEECNYLNGTPRSSSTGSGKNKPSIYQTGQYNGGPNAGWEREEKSAQNATAQSSSTKSNSRSNKNNPYAGWRRGDSTAPYESGRKSIKAITSIKAAHGDHGGFSYGKYQIATNTGTMGQYLKTSKYKEEFEGLKPGTKAFNHKWIEIADRDPSGFEKDQHEFIERTHYLPQMNKLKKNGIDFSNRGPAIEDAVWSTSVQYGAHTNVIQKAFEGKDVSKMSNAQIINVLQTYKYNTADLYYRSSSKETKDSVRKRCLDEKETLLNLDAKGKQ